MTNGCVSMWKRKREAKRDGVERKASPDFFQKNSELKKAFSKLDLGRKKIETRKVRKTKI